MFKLGKKAKDDDGNPFDGYVADGLAAADFKAEADADADVAIPSEPTPEIEALNASAPQPPAPVAKPTPPPTPAPKPPAPASPSAPPVSAPTAPGPGAAHVTPANPTSEQVDTAIKQAEAETEMPKDELLEVGVTPPQIGAQEQPITTEQVEKVVVEAPAPPRTMNGPGQAGRTVPVLSTDEERAAAMSTHRELAELLGWAERDTNDHMNDIQLVIDDLNSKIDHLRTSFAQDTARLSEDAKIAFKENIEKNITLLKDQVNREQAKKDILRSQKEEFIDKIHDALKKYRDSKR